ncbi:MAG TPA: glycosyltransferase family 2 protein [Steroidobacteraceae bacterium]|nr:glycosyltransferase family 2 protein [Steroidobacteraceae bacterium]
MAERHGTVEPFVSVVTPFYNTASLLAQCVESVLTQTHSNFEYILADNCSTDGSSEIAQSFAARDSRIRYLRFEEFLPQVPNYNRALRAISPESKYCKIVQADDWIFPTCVAEMVGVAEQYPSIVLVGAYTLIEKDVYLAGLPFPSRFISGRDICRKYLLEGLYVFGSPTATLLRADVVRARQSFFAEDSPVEDVEICFELLQHGDFGFLNQVLTFTRRENESHMTSLKKFRLDTLAEAIVVRKYGRAFLSTAEFEARVRATTAAEYRVLAEGLLLMRPKAFWELHACGLHSTGARINPLRIAGVAALRVLDLVLNPKNTIEGLARKLARR